MTIHLIIPGSPVAMQRHRAIRRGKFISMYNPQAKEKKAVMQEIALQYTGAPLEGPVAVVATFYMPIPKSTSKKRKALLEGTPHTKKIDLDNILKFSLDVMTGIVYVDDAQIWKIDAKKVWTSEEPRTELDIRLWSIFGFTNRR